MKKFEIDAKGFKQLQEGRPKWSFVRELISNSFDENITFCKVTIKKEDRDPAIIIVEDDGDGFRSLRDAYTLFAPTPKRSNPNVRGRFNLGEKEFASISKEMIIESTKGGVHFQSDGKRKRINKKRDCGTKVTVKINWSYFDIEKIKDMVQLFIPDKGISLILNSTQILSPLLVSSDLEKLKTVIFKDGALRPTIRISRIDIYELKSGQTKGWLYELGIPVQEIDCNYNVNVSQKIPLNPNRDNVSDSYLQDIYAIVLNNMSDRLIEYNVSETWIRKATEDDLIKKDTLVKVKEKRFGNAVLWSSDIGANERALQAGKEIVHGKTLSSKEREKFKEVGLVSSKVEFGRSPKAVESIPESKWTKGMHKLVKLTKHLSKELQYKDINVRFISDFQIREVAIYGLNTITFNIVHFGKKNTEPPFNGYVIGTIIHELAHRKGAGHFDMAYINELTKLSGRCVVLALNNNELRNKIE